ncbi:MAG: PEP-CTERM sorting domain-containing protein [Opitutales bacterium]
MPLRLLAASGGLALSLAAGPYPPEAGLEGSTALSSEDPAIVAWATGWTDYLPGPEASETFQTPDLALGPATPPGARDPFDIVSLGRGGSIVLTFAWPIADGPGADFAVFENANVPGFLELAFVEVSSDGLNYVRFPSDSLTPEPVGPFANTMFADNIDGLAGKYEIGYGTPFDLADLAGTEGLDLGAITHLRLIDIVGDGNTTDTSGDPIFDPYPTSGSAGFDLDAVAVLHRAAIPPPADTTLTTQTDGSLRLGWTGQAGLTYRVERSPDLSTWSLLESRPATDSGSDAVDLPAPGAGPEFYRVRAVLED